MRSFRCLLPPLLLLLALASCGPKTDLFVVFDKDGGYQAFGNILSLALASPEGIHSGAVGLPAGSILVFRVDGAWHGAAIQAGTAYRAGADGKLQRLSAVDLRKSGEELARQFGVAPGASVSRPGKAGPPGGN